MKKLISLLGATFLTASTGTTIISCATKPAEKDPFYQLPTAKPKTMDEVIEIIGYYYDLANFYNEEFYNKDAGKIEAIDSENWQKMNISYFIADDCMTYYAYEHLDYHQVIEFTTPKGEDYYNYPISLDSFNYAYNLNMEKHNESTTQHTKEWYTNWYNWALTTE